MYAYTRQKRRSWSYFLNKSLMMASTSSKDLAGEAQRPNDAVAKCIATSNKCISAVALLATSSDALVTGSFLFLVVMPGATSFLLLVAMHLLLLAMPVLLVPMIRAENMSSSWAAAASQQNTLQITLPKGDQL